MNTTTTRVAVIGNYSGRNAGDAAILGGLLRDITETFPDRDLVFEVPTINPGFIRRTYRDYPVRPVGLLPWNLSVKILGLPIVRCVLRADLVLVTDAILFDHKLYNPLFNYLHTLSWVLPMAARRGVPIVLYNVSLGPAYTKVGRDCLARVLEVTDKLIVRDPPSAQLARSLSPRGPKPRMGADCALSIRPADAEEVERIAEEHGLLRTGRPVLGFNVNRYLDVFLGDDARGVGAAWFQDTVAAVLDRAVRELGVEILMVQTHPMDAGILDGVLRKTDERAHISVVRNPPVGHTVLAGLLGRAEAFVGMRTHSLILASLMGTPVGGIIATPKNRGYLEAIGFQDMALEFPDLDGDSLCNLVHTVWSRRDDLAARLAETMPPQRGAAAAAARELAPWLGAPAVLDRALPDEPGVRASG